MPSGTSILVGSTLQTYILGAKLSTQVTFPTDPLRGQEVPSFIRELFSNDPLEPPGSALHALLGPDQTVTTSYDLLL